ncbi:MAG: DUF3343 domain-containing protein [Oscillospiraceae bacterium]|jgi:hypothetical protein|nr:DUF3343 domain-containing protein [Oscillospiraceae bacterium]
MTESFGIAAFRSRQQVLRLQSALRRAGLKAEIVATPRDVAIGCGLSVQFDLNETEQVMQTYYRLGPSNLIGFYRLDRVDNKTSRLTPLMLPTR